MERVNTGIPGLDKLIGGGFEKGSIVEVAGSEGTFKSTFALQFALEGVKRNEKVVYVSLEEQKESFESTVRIFGWGKNFSKIDFRHIDVKQVIASLGVSYNGEGPELLAKKLLKTFDSGIDRLVLDSATTLALYSSRTSVKLTGDKKWGFITPSCGDIRVMLYYLSSELRKSGATVLFLAESGKGELYAAEEVLKYVCDAKIELKKSSLGTESPRTMIIRKMRHTRHPLDEMALVVTANGLDVTDIAGK